MASALSLWLLSSLFLAALSDPAMWGYSCSDIKLTPPGLKSLVAADPAGPIQIFSVRRHDIRDDYSDNIVFNGNDDLSLSDVLNRKLWDQPLETNGPNVTLTNYNPEQNCDLDFVIVFFNQEASKYYKARITESVENEEDYEMDPNLPRVYMNQDFCTVIVPITPNPSFELYSGLKGSARRIFGTGDAAVQGYNISRIYVYGPVFTLIPTKDHRVQFYKCSDGPSPVLKAGEDWFVVSSTDAFPGALAVKDKKISFSLPKQGIVSMDIRNFNITGGVKVTATDSGLFKSFSGSGQFDTFKAKGTSFTIEYQTEFTQAALASGAGRGEYFTLHIKPTMKGQ